MCAPRVTADGLAATAARLRVALDEPHQIHGDQVIVAGSVGTYLAAPGETEVEALRMADQAMYAIKGRHLSRRLARVTLNTDARRWTGG